MAAEDLGSAVLRITVDDGAARKSLDLLRQDIEKAAPVIGGGGVGAAARRSPISARQRELEQTFAQREQRLRSLELSVFRAQEQRLRSAGRAAKQGRGFDVSGAVSSAVIGGAFPLLFGQGTGAAAGGLFGGLLGAAGGPGGGFAGSLVGTAIGQVADQFRQLSVALDDPIKALDLLKERAALSGRGIELLAEQLVAAGRSAEASALIQSDLGSVLDPSVIRTVAAANEAYSRNVGELQLKLGAFLSGPATGFSSWLTEIINRVTALPTGLPTQRGSLATRGQGAALGIGGTLLAGLGLGLSLTGVGAGVGIPIALAGAGLGGVGALQIGGAESQQQQIAAAEITEKNQQRILEIDEARIGYQRQINAANRTGQFNTQRELQLKDQLAAIEQERQKAIAAFASTPGDTRPGEVRAFRAQIEALKLRREELEKNLDVQTKLIQADARIAQLQAGGFERDALVEQLRRVGIAGGDPVASLAQQQSLLAQIAALDRNRAATAQLQVSNYQLGAQALDRQFAAAQRVASIPTTGGISIERDTAQLAEGLREQVARARSRELELTAQITALQIRGGEYAATQIRGLQLDQVNAARETRNLIFDASNRLQSAGESLRESAKTAQESIRSTLASNFANLRPQLQGRLLSDALRRVDRSRFNIGTIRTTEDLFRLASASESIKRQEEIIDQSESAIVKVNSRLADATERLSDKDWNVTVNVQGTNGAQVIGDVVGATT